MVSLHSPHSNPLCPVSRTTGTWSTRAHERRVAMKSYRFSASFSAIWLTLVINCSMKLNFVGPWPHPWVVVAVDRPPRVQSRGLLTQWRAKIRNRTLRRKHGVGIYFVISLSTVVAATWRGWTHNVQCIDRSSDRSDCACTLYPMVVQDIKIPSCKRHITDKLTKMRHSKLAML